jgi:hypothetical protein
MMHLSTTFGLQRQTSHTTASTTFWCKTGADCDEEETKEREEGVYITILGGHKTDHGSSS